ncbi:DUF4956 domain-containing protein [Synechococcus sp. N5]|uniref:DUF4956 domain-containing protein n=1 Tax=Synechococcus sp. N5 TaxID=2575515 RepID=UPI0010BD16BA|nr:DUF4956 domain-containing protein [Synechococcus sp. N5]
MPNFLLSEISIPSDQLSESITLTLRQGLIITLVALVCGFIVRKLYLNYTLTYSSPRGFANTLAMVLLSVSALIAIVKSSLALSLGLVGALSVVRFRTAVKEPFTLSFILWSVCLGISIGAEQFTFTALILIAGALIIFMLFRKTILPSKTKSGSYINQFVSDTLLLSTEKPSSIYRAFDTLSKHIKSFNVKSLSSTSENTSAVLMLNISDTKELELITKALEQDPEIISFSFYNNAIE